MNLQMILGFIIFTSFFGVLGLQDYSTYADEDIQHQFSSSELDDMNFTTKQQETNELDEDFPTTSENVSKKSFHEENEVEDDLKDSKSSLQSSESSTFNPQVGDEAGFQKRFHEFLQKIRPRIIKITDSAENLHLEDTKAEQPPVRRQVQPWQNWVEPSYSWSPTLHPAEPSPEVITEPTVSNVNSLLKNDTSLETEVHSTEDDTRMEQPQYYQKNYYYNYYPVIDGNAYKQVSRWSSSQEEVGTKKNSPQVVENVEKVPKKSPCRQYLQIIKQVIEKLEENSDDAADYPNDYDEYWRENARDTGHRVFTTHLFGPTLYVDNSGRVSHINIKENTNRKAQIGVRNETPELKTSESTTKPPVTTSQPITEKFLIGHLKSQYRLFNESMRSLPENTSNFSWLRNFIEHFLSLANATEGAEENQTTVQLSTVRSTTPTKQLEVHETTVKPKTDQTAFEDNGDTKATFPLTTTNPPGWYSTEERITRVSNGAERRSNVTPGNSILSKTKAVLEPSLPHQTIPPSTTVIHTSHTKMMLYEPIQGTTEAEGQDERDCNDKMLPCPDTINITYPLNGYCNRYVSCESGRAMRRTCPEGLQFSIITKNCDLPHNSICTYSCPEANGYYGIPGDCGGYFICKNYIPEYRMCPPNMHWDVKRNFCTFADLSSCAMKCPKPNDIKNYDGDCKAYIICINGVPSYHKCPPNSVFNKDSQSCVQPHQFPCTDDPRLITKIVNPNVVCRDPNIKESSRVWCNNFYNNNNTVFKNVTQH